MYSIECTCATNSIHWQKRRSSVIMWPYRNFWRLFFILILYVWRIFMHHTISSEKQKHNWVRWIKIIGHVMASETDVNNHKSEDSVKMNRKKIKQQTTVDRSAIKLDLTPSIKCHTTVEYGYGWSRGSYKRCATSVIYYYFCILCSTEMEMPTHDRFIRLFFMQLICVYMNIYESTVGSLNRFRQLFVFFSLLNSIDCTD